MSGCQDTEYSYDAWFQGRPNGAFTFVALRALKSLPTKATYRDWYNAIRKMLPSQQYPQSPNLYGSTNEALGRNGLRRQKCQKRGLPGVFLDEPADPLLA